MSNMEIAEQVFEEHTDKGETRDQIIIAMVMAGISLNSAQNYYKEIAKEKGLIRPRLGHKKEAMQFIVESGVDILNDEARSELKRALSDTFEVSLGTAHDYIRAYATDAEIALPSMGPKGQNNEEIYQFIVNNPTIDKPGFRDFMDSLGRSKGNVDETWRGVLLARKIIVSGIWQDVELPEAA